MLRVRRTMDSQAAKGRPHGRVTYGYKRVYDTDTRELKEQIPHPGQAPIVKEIITQIAGGVPINSITRDLHRRAIPPPGGARWTRDHVRRIARNPAYNGKRSYNGTLFDAMWPPLVNPVTFEAAELHLYRPGAADHPARPGPLAAVPHRDLRRVRSAARRAAQRGRPRKSTYPMYRCSRDACVFIRMDYLDAYVWAGCSG